MKNENRTTKLVKQLAEQQRNEGIQSARKQMKFGMGIAYLTGFACGLLTMAIVTLLAFYFATL